MKTTKIKIILASLLLIAVNFSSCIEDKAMGPPLKGTRWKLVGIVNVHSGEWRELEPKHCEECYTITFDKNYSGTAYSVSETWKVDLLDTNGNMHFIRMCELYLEDGKTYCDSSRFRKGITLAGIGPWEVRNDELKIYDSNGSGYLLFKSRKQ